MIVFVHPKCTTCHKALQFLKNHNIAHQEINIIETPPSIAQLKKMLAFYQGDIRKLFNTSGQLYRSLELSNKLSSMSTDEALQLLHSNGMLVKRPFLLTDAAGMVGFKPELYEKLLP